MNEAIQRAIHKIAGQTGIRTLRGGAVLGGSSAIEHGLRLVRNMVLTRILLPDAIGVMALVLTFTYLFDVLTAVGFKEAVIQSGRAEKPTYLNAVWWLSLARSLALYAAAFVAAPLAATFYNNADLTGLVRVAFLASVANGLLSPRVYVALKQMRYVRWSVISLGGGGMGVVVTILMVLKLHNAWGLVWGYVAEAVCKTALSFVICPFRPTLAFDKADSSALLHFSKGMVGLPIILAVCTEADSFVVGKLFSPADFGLYSMARTLALGPLLLVSTHLTNLLLPLLSEAKQQPARLNRLVLASTNALLLCGFPVVGFVWMFGGEILGLTYGQSYRAVAIPFALIVTSNVVVLAHAPVVLVYLARGQSARHRLYSAWRALTVAVLIWPAAHWLGLIGAPVAIFVALLLNHAVRLLDLRRMQGLNLRAYFGACAQVALMAAPVVGVGVLVKILLHSNVPFVIWGVAILAISGATLFILKDSVLVRQPMRSVVRKLSFLVRGCEAD